MIAGYPLARFFRSPLDASLQFWLVALFIVMAFMTGGSSRVDVQSLAILRPLSVVACGVAIVTLRRDHVVGREWLLGGIAMMFVLAALHVAPLPSSFWQALPGRGAIAQLDQLTGLREIARPLTFSPVTGWEALMSLFAPLAVLLFGIQLSRNDLYRLLPLLIGLGALSGLLGLLQVVGSNESPLYLYQATNGGSAVGLFANRNHAAVLLACLFPMLAVFASTADADQQNHRQLIAAVLAIGLVPLILVTGSRSALLIAVIGLLGGALLYRRPVPSRPARRKTARSRFGNVPLLIGLAVICLAFITIYFARAEALDRLFSDGNVEDHRGAYWTASLRLFWEYFPWGSGSGSFADAFRAAEPARILDPTYVNRAHNDWVEMALTLGLPGIAILAATAFFFFRQATRLARRDDGKRRSVTFGRMAAIVIIMIAVASAFDYPLRTPAIMCLFMVLILWLSGPPKEPGRSSTPI